MPSFFALPNLNNPPSLASMHFGSLVANPAFPHQNYFDPSSAPPYSQPKVDSDELRNFAEVVGSIREGRLRALMTHFASAAVSGSSKKEFNLSSQQVKDYRVDNSTSWFRTICGMPETRKWMEETMKTGPAYLVVGCRTFLDAKIFGAEESCGSGSVAGAEPNHGAGGEMHYSQSKSGGRGYEAPNERVFMVQYRRVTYKFFLAKSVDDAFLEPNNRWKQLVKLRGPEEVIEADLGDEAEQEDGYEKELSMDGKETYVFHSKMAPAPVS